ncbi:Endonuclease-reverse transcriptase [Operophtera brumata]|uniref:Endonuclease-reverse transcriptase n=1 Tax=Operophtera brumata TaxID=104452 RepID=A0A0L7KKF7_OPEBR|nr:Endonuclease-reverse transcriptase [Operophtera brumata]
MKIIEKYLEHSGAVKRAYKHLNNSKQLLSQLKNKEGEIVTNRKELMQIETDFYKDLYTKTDPLPNHHNNIIVPRNDEPVPEFHENEILQSIKQLKPEKSPGLDGITN